MMQTNVDRHSQTRGARREGEAPAEPRLAGRLALPRREFANDDLDTLGPIRTSVQRRRVLSMSLGFALTMLIGDALLARIRLPKVYGSRNQALEKWELYAGSEASPDVVFLGCSYEWCGISPRVVDAEVGERLGRPIRSLNLAVSANSLWAQSMMVRRMLEDGSPPPVVYLGLSADALRRDAGRAWFINGLRALGDVRDIPDAATIDLDTLGEAVLTGLFPSYHRWEDVRIMAHNLTVGAPMMPTQKLRIDSSGWGEWNGRSKTEDGRLRTEGQSDLLVADVNVRALAWSVESLRRLGVIVRLVEMPMPNATHSLCDRLADIQDGPERWLIVADHVCGHTSPVGPADFFDQGHLNPTGARKFSTWLATDVAEAVRQAGPRPGAVRLAGSAGPTPP